jgi:bacterioferritin
MPITKSELIKLLNQDIAKEWAAAVQYVQHAAMITGAEFQTIQKEMIVHANEELGHSIQLSDLITQLGGKVTTEVDKRYVSNDNKAMLEQDLAGENDAIERYKKRVGQANQLGEYGVAKILTEILIVEEEHARDLRAALGK